MLYLAPQRRSAVNECMLDISQSSSKFPYTGSCWSNIQHVIDTPFQVSFCPCGHECQQHLTLCAALRFSWYLILSYQLQRARKRSLSCGQTTSDHLFTLACILVL